MIDLTEVTKFSLYVMDKIRPEIEKGNFRAIYRYVQHLEALVRFAAIVEDRNNVGFPVIKPPN